MTDDLFVYANYVEALTEGPTPTRGSTNIDQLFPPVVNKQKKIGLKCGLGTSLVSAALFEIRQPNGRQSLETRVFAVDGLQVNRGLELSIFGEPMDGVRLMGGFTFMDAELRRTEGGANDGNDVNGIPDTAISLYGEYDTP